MKNIKFLLIAICNILLFQNVMAQTYYYSFPNVTVVNAVPRVTFINATGTLSTYICHEKVKGLMILYNQSNTLTFVDQNKTDGSSMNIHGDYYYDIPATMLNKIEQVIDSYLIAAEKTRVKGDKLLVSLYLDSNTGAVKEVEYEFLTNGAFATIPPATYYKIEATLKRDFRVTMLPEGRKLNYNIYFETYP